MPVSTDTFRNIKVLNLLFLASAVLLTFSTLLLVVADWDRQWRGIQVDSRRWEAAMTKDAIKIAEDGEVEHQRAVLDAQLQELEQSLAVDRIAGIQKKLDDATSNKNRRSLRLAAEKGNITPKQQQIERAVFTYGQNAAEVAKLRKELATILASYQSQANHMAGIEREIESLKKSLATEHEKVTAVKKEIANVTRILTANKDKLKELEPNIGMEVFDQIRNAPLLDWLHPSLKPHQDVLPDVRFEVNFMTTESIDRCRTCHVNIDNPAFELQTQMDFIERQIAQLVGQNVNSIDKPVVMLDYWRHAALLAGDNAKRGLKRIEQSTSSYLKNLNEDLEFESPAQLYAELKRIAIEENGSDDISRNRWYLARNYYRSDIQKMLADQLGKSQYAQLVETFRRALIAQYNQHREGKGMGELSASPVLLAHPNLDLFVGADSAHPARGSMGCTVCHEGSGQETQFVHSAHTPRNIWVDAKTGMQIPNALIMMSGTTLEVQKFLRKKNRPSARALKAGMAWPTLAVGSTKDHGDAHSGGHGETHGGVGRRVHHDVNINSEGDPAPYAPEIADHSQAAAWQDPANHNTLHKAVHQSEYWTKQFGWHKIKHMYWEKPMHTLDYIESSCSKCHTEIYDLKASAPKLFEGRKLFAQIGCANCHAVTDLADDLDVKKIGPSLVNIKDKLSAPMMGSWIWAPKAFRPFARMPHYFMLENNSSPTDILRTRVEVAAMTHYLQKTQPDPEYYKQQNQPVPDYKPITAPSVAGSVEVGRELFTSVGCLACHTNMTETGEAWITRDLVKRSHVDDAEAQEIYSNMTYNQRHWYALEHLEDKIVQIGPELSGVGTKLKADRTDLQARTWLYDWLINPRHYSDYTIMPSFRLSEQEANDMVSYLLSLERPDDYQVVDFQNLDKQAKHMLFDLVTSLKTGQTTTLELAKGETSKLSQDEQLLFLGSKVIGHYGCSGCHKINGFEQATSACTTLDGWGLKDPHKLDYGYFDHAFDAQREKSIEVTKIKHEGLLADATQITADNQDKIETYRIDWEAIGSTRRPWLYHKLHNPRVYDRARVNLEGSINGDELNIGRPYDKLKMPKFFLNDKQARALVTYVTSIRKPLVSNSLMNATYNDQRLRQVRGQQMATMYNCYGCHNIEANKVQMHQYFGVHNADGSFNENALNWAPPRLIGQGAKTQPNWLFNFFQDVKPIRPWLEIRMPSFPLDGNDATTLVDYLASHSLTLAADLAEHCTPIEEFIKANPEADWITAPALKSHRDYIRSFAVRADLSPARKLDARYTDADELQTNWTNLLGQIAVLAETYETQYPYVQQSAPKEDEARLQRGEKLFVEMGCMAGACHRIGDEQLLADKGFSQFLAAAQSTAANDDDDDDDDDDDEAGGEVEAPVIRIAPNTTPEGAPNLTDTAQRIQRDWMAKWLRYSHTIQPGTRMQEFFQENKTHFEAMGYAEDTIIEKSAMYGHTADAQANLVMDFLYSAGPKRITLTPDLEGKRLSSMPTKMIELAPLKAPEGMAVKPVTTDPEKQAPTTDKPAQEPIKPTVIATVSSIKLHDGEQASSDGSRIVGVVNFTGKKRRRKPINMSVDLVCNSSHGDAIPLTERLVVNKDNTVQNVLIRVVDAPKGGSIPTKPAIIDQIGCQYIPHVQAAMAGQKVVILNSDPTLHNINCKPKKNKAFNKGLPAKGMMINKVFTKSELGIPLKCDVHPWMTGFLHILDNPYFAVSDVQGRFEIKNLPAGKYILETVHEDKKIKPVRFEVQVKADTSHRADVTVKR